MSMAVLQSQNQIEESRRELVRRSLSTLDSSLAAALRRLRLNRSPVIGDLRKSWDVLRTIEFIERRVPKEGAVLDLGAYGSEIPVALFRLGYRNITGVDLDPALPRMPHADAIRYQIADFMHTKLADSSFDAITAISTIEHGFQSDRLLTEVARLLRPGGYFVASFDYWPDKIDTTGTKLFNMTWTIFSKAEINAFVDDAKRKGLVPPEPLAMDANERPIAFGGKQYTFGWLALQKLP